MTTHARKVHRSPGGPSARLTKRARAGRSRTAYASLASAILHVTGVILFALSWTQRMPEQEAVPLVDGNPMRVSFVLMPNPAPATSGPRVAPAVQEPTRPVVEQTPKPPAERPTPTSPERPKPVPEARSVAKPQPLAPRPDAEPPPTKPLTTAARMLRPDPTALHDAREVTLDDASDHSNTDARDDADGPRIVEAQQLIAYESDAVADPSRSQNDADDDARGPSASSSPPTPIAGRRLAQIASALSQIAEAASADADPSPVDVVFLLDVSGSMENNVRAVGENLSMMMSELSRRGTDATFGVVKFAIVTIRVFPQTSDTKRLENLLANMKIGGDERALTALFKAQRRVKFRQEAQRRFVLVTDEPLKGTPSLPEVLARLRTQGIVVDVIGLNIPEHRLLAKATGGTWHQIPGEPK